MKSKPFWLPEVKDLDAEFVLKPLKDNFLNDGSYTTEFERALANLLGVRETVAVTSGTTALFLSLYALGVGAGDEVLVPDVTFVATANAVVLTGATPVLVDVEPDSLQLSAEACEQALTSRTRAIVPVHVSGRPVAMTSLLELAASRELAVVEDAAEALLSKYQGRYLGTLGEAGCFSLSPNKTITTGQGGFVATDSEQVATRLRELKDQGRQLRGTGGADRHDVVGFNFKFTNMQAAVGLAQLTYLKSRAERQCAIYQQYREELAELEEVQFLQTDSQGGTVPQWTDALVERRDELFEYLEERSAHCRKFWHPMHSHKPYRRPDSEFPVASALVPRALWLPSAFQLTEADVSEICEQIREFYQR